MSPGEPLDEDVRQEAADQAVEDDRLGEREAEPLDALELTAELGLAGDALDHRAEDVADADAGPERAETDAESERDRLAGVGIGNIFGSMIQSVARQPELRGELQGIQWLGFALTEAVVFYGLLGSILAYVLV